MFVITFYLCCEIIYYITQDLIFIYKKGIYIDNSFDDFILSTWKPYPDNLRIKNPEKTESELTEIKKQQEEPDFLQITVFTLIAVLYSE